MKVIKEIHMRMPGRQESKHPVIYGKGRGIRLPRRAVLTRSWRRTAPILPFEPIEIFPFQQHFLPISLHFPTPKLGAPFRSSNSYKLQSKEHLHSLWVQGPTYSVCFQAVWSYISFFAFVGVCFFFLNAYRIRMGDLSDGNSYKSLWLQTALL